jgi:hypothetical protein
LPDSIIFLSLVEARMGESVPLMWN